MMQKRTKHIFFKMEFLELGSYASDSKGKFLWIAKGQEKKCRCPERIRRLKFSVRIQIYSLPIFPMGLNLGKFFILKKSWKVRRHGIRMTFLMMGLGIFKIFL